MLFRHSLGKMLVWLVRSNQCLRNPLFSIRVYNLHGSNDKNGQQTLESFEIPIILL